MKKTVLALAIFGVVALSLGIVGSAYAHGPIYGHGYGMMGDEEGPLHDAMIAAFAEAVGLTPEEVEARHDAGETLWQIAASQGLSPEEIRDLLLTVRQKALEQAVAEGLLTPEQAEWMQSHMGRGAYGGFGACDGSGPAFRGPGFGPAGRMGNWSNTAPGR
ncbi:MAG: LysM peptidoglycan-binding domain-containing protein [Anaerolineae bacterium]|nr:MAG: LysM peptidoglycan-binding domain-containing protein [Anaerolineae bacterium]